MLTPSRAATEPTCSPAATCVGRLTNDIPGALTVTVTPGAARNPGAVAVTVVAPAASGSNATPPAATLDGEFDCPAAIVTVRDCPVAAVVTNWPTAVFAVTDRHRHARRPGPDRLRRAELPDAFRTPMITVTAESVDNVVVDDVTLSDRPDPRTVAVPWPA